MPQPARAATAVPQQQPAAQQPQPQRGMAALAAAAAAAAALGPVAAIAPPAVAVAAASKTLLDAMEVVFRQRRSGLGRQLTAVAHAQMPGTPAERVRELVAEEMRREVEFQRKAIARLESDLPAALGLADPAARAAAVAKIIERERRFIAQREQAAAQRMVSALEADALKLDSPHGAYWKLSPLVRNHCVECLAMAEKFWPWEVLDSYKLPMHPNCGCRLLSLDEAIHAGLMSAEDVPDAGEALKHAKLLMTEARRLQESLTADELEALSAELQGRVIQEAPLWRDILRFPKGTAHGGQFEPKAGGDPGAASKHLQEMLKLRIDATAAPKFSRDGRTIRVGGKAGQDVFVPRAARWRHEANGHVYESPPQSTSVYRDGLLIHPDHVDAGGWVSDREAGPGLPLGSPEERKPEELLALPAPERQSAIPDYTGTPLTLGKRAGGSTGARWAFDAEGQRWLIKTYNGNQDRVAAEVLANTIYRELGADVARAGVLRAKVEPPERAPNFRSIKDRKVNEPPMPKDKRISTGMVVREPDGRVWLYEPKGHFGGYEHSFPKGGLEKGYSAQQNAHKELWEETGLRAQITGYIGDYKGTSGTTRYYLATRTGGTPHEPDDTPYVEGGNETAAVKLVSPEAAAGMLNVARDKHVLADALKQGDPKPAPAEKPPGGEPQIITALAYPTVTGETRKITEPNRELGRHFMADALVANWDFIGLTDDNVLWTPEGKPVRLDQGGTFQFRAQGAPKPYGPVPTEAWTMLDPKGQGFDKVDVTPEMMRRQAQKIGETLTDDRIDSLVNAAPFRDQKMREEVRQSLKDRVRWMRDFAAGEQQMPTALEGHGDVHGAMTAAQRKLELFPEQHEALGTFLEDPKARGRIQASLRSKDGKVPQELWPTVRELDGVVRHQRTPEDMVVYRPMDEPKDPAAMVGKVVADRAFATATPSRSEAREAPAMLRLHVPAGTGALYLPAVEGAETPGGMSMLLGRGTRVRIRAAHREGGRTVLHGVVLPGMARPPLPPKPAKPAKPKPAAA